MKSATRLLRTLGLTTALAAAAGLGTASAQTVNWDPRTGDVWVDTWLDDINRYGGRYQQPFVDEMVRYYGAPRDLVTSLLLERDWEPGDVYYACAIAQVVGRPCRYVVDEWERDGRGEGWGALAQRMGIKPGSAEFHQLKRGFVSSYDRWGRPIRIDDDLYDDYPERARLIREGRDDRNWRRADDDDRGNRGNAGRGNDGNRGNANANRGNGNGNANAGNADKGRGNSGKGNGNGNRGDKGNAGNNGNGNKGNADKGRGNNGNGNGNSNGKGNGRGG